MVAGSGSRVSDVEFQPPGTEPSARVRPLGPPVSSQRYAGVHNLCYSMVIEEPFERDFGWEKHYRMRNWIKRHSDFGRITENGRVHLEESGGRLEDGPGAAGHTISIKFRVDGDDPTENERRAQSIAEGIRLTLEMKYGCKLSDPVSKGAPKHSITGDPLARALTREGISIHGPPGVDKTPDEEGTLELESAKTVREYQAGIAAMPEMRDVLLGIKAALAEQTKAIAEMGQGIQDSIRGQAEIARRIQGMQRREPAGRDPLRRTNQVKPEQASRGGFG